MTLDQRIQQDLKDLYNGGNLPGTIQEAQKLNGLIPSKQGQTSFSTTGLPGYFTGDRKAKTVMVMLNPGEDVTKANASYMNKMNFLGMTNANDINGYHKGNQSYGHLDRHRLDNFDLKQAFFFHKWSNTGINIPNGFCANPKSSQQILLLAKENVLTQKLQLELIPYASSSFKAFNKSKLNLIVPFVETLFDEIFSYERKYVVFCARKFEKVFHEYNKTHPGSVTIKKIKNKWIPSRSKSKPGSCIGLYINYKNFKMKAIIANTFPRQDLPNAYDLMEDYGEFCYNEFLKL